MQLMFLDFSALFLDCASHNLIKYTNLSTFLKFLGAGNKNRAEMPGF